MDLNTAQTEPKNDGLAELLKSYGETINEGIVVDANCGFITVARQMCFMRVQEQKKYPSIPLIERFENDHPLTRGLSAINLPFVSPLAAAGHGTAHRTRTFSVLMQCANHKLRLVSAHIRN